MKKFTLLSALVLFFGLGIHSLSSAQTYLNFTFAQAGVLSASAGADDLICPGDSAMIGGAPTADGGTSPYVYSWTPSSGVIDPSAANTMAAPGITTNYMLTVTDGENCSAFDTVLVEIDTCVGMTENLDLNAFEVYPNPNAGEFMVKIGLDNPVAELTMSLTDLSGKVLMTRTLTQASGQIKEPVQLNGLSRGAYFIRVEVDGQQLSRKVMIR